MLDLVETPENEEKATLTVGGERHDDALEVMGFVPAVDGGPVSIRVQRFEKKTALVLLTLLVAGCGSSTAPSPPAHLYTSALSDWQAGREVDGATITAAILQRPQDDTMLDMMMTSWHPISCNLPAETYIGADDRLRYFIFTDGQPVYLGSLLGM